MSLPPHLETLRGHLATALNALATYEKLVIAQSWGVEASERSKDKALHDVEHRLSQACDHIGIMPAEKRMLLDIIERHRVEFARLKTAIDGRVYADR